MLRESAVKSNLRHRTCLWFDKPSLVNWSESGLCPQMWPMTEKHTQDPTRWPGPSKSEISEEVGLWRSFAPLCDRTDQRQTVWDHFIPHPVSPAPSLLFSSFSALFLFQCPAHAPHWPPSLSSFFFSPCLAQHLSNSVVGPVVSSSMVFMITLWVHSDLGHYSHTMDGAVHTGEHCKCCGPLPMCVCVCVCVRQWEREGEWEGGCKTSLKTGAREREYEPERALLHLW